MRIKPKHLGLFTIMIWIVAYSRIILVHFETFVNFESIRLEKRSCQNFLATQEVYNLLITEI